MTEVTHVAVARLEKQVIMSPSPRRINSYFAVAPVVVSFFFIVENMVGLFGFTGWVIVMQWRAECIRGRFHHMSAVRPDG